MRTLLWVGAMALACFSTSAAAVTAHGEASARGKRSTLMAGDSPVQRHYYKSLHAADTLP